MIDLHTHILPNIDDGAENLEESVKIITKAKKAGYTGIVASSHYIEGSYNANNIKKLELIAKINLELEKNHIDVQIFTGNEVFFTENLVSLIDKGEIFTINNSKYVLMEFPLNENIPNMQNMLFKIFSAHVVPIVAHPERYSYVQKNPNMLIPLIDQGLLFQLNSGSLFGRYGKTAQKTAEILLKNNMIHFVGTDTHKGTMAYENIDEARIIVSKIVGKKNSDTIFEKNPKLVINNKTIVPDEPTEYKKKLFEF